MPHKPHPFWLGELPFPVERTRRHVEPQVQPTFNWLAAGALVSVPVEFWLFGRWQP